MYYRNRNTQKRLKKLHNQIGKSYFYGVYYNTQKKRYKRIYLGDKYYRKRCNKRLRMKLKNNYDLIIQNNDYRRLTEYW